VTFPSGSVPIIGAGPTGTLLAILLQRRGVQVTLYESRTDPRKSAAQEAGRTINLALADRGIHALKLAGVLDQIEGALVPMRGRWVHQRDGRSSLQPYGQRPHEVIFSISRRRLNQALLDVAERREGVRVEFEHRFEHADFERQVAHVRNLRSDRPLAIPMQPLLATDGAGSLLRRRMAAAGLIAAHESSLEHGYKELTIPPGPGGEHRMEREALHIWPRGDYMLIALPNTDGSFTATLFLPMEGTLSFASLISPAAIEEFLSSSFSDVRDLMPNCVAEFQHNPTGFLGTVYAEPWHYRGTAALVGDSAHAIVPFHGQGMNCCFEDCVEFDGCLARRSSWESVFADFYALRKPNTDAIAAMALENYLEMRERVADPRFQLQRSVALELERRLPQRFIPRYSMVMFHHEIPYRTALERGTVQEQILAELTADTTALSDVELLRAEREVERRLEPISQDRSSVTKLNG
jgi:kynurenine 3-monooxygenase